jgi:dethiobiotin synthetase
MTAYFVTATGTDIGKTFVTAGLIRAMRGMGLRPSALKPVVSGFDRAQAAESDPGVLLAAMGETITEDALDRVAPWRFAAPLSPDMAAAREGREVDFTALIALCRDALRDAPGPLFIEGVGGVMVPLDRRHTVLDWMTALELPVLLVAGAYLGSISHTLTALDVLSQARLDVPALVLNDSGNNPVPLEETATTLARFTRVPIHLIPRVDHLSGADEAFSRLAKKL